MSFVAMSRFRRLKDFRIKNWTKERVRMIGKAPGFGPMRREDAYLADRHDRVSAFSGKLHTRRVVRYLPQL